MTVVTDWVVVEVEVLVEPELVAELEEVEVVADGALPVVEAKVAT